MAIKNTISPWVGRDTFIQPHLIDESWPDKYNFILLDEEEDLEYALKQTNGKLLAVDTETTGLDPEVDNIVGYSFSSDGRTGYYVPIRHKSGKNILPKKALDLLYEAMQKAKVVMMFNMRFDCRMFEYENWTSDYRSSRDPKDWGGYDMMGIKVFDTAQMMFLADTDNYANVSLKGAAAHIGIKMQTFEEVSGGVRFDYVDPIDGTYYAASDAIVTYKLGNGIGIKMYQEAKTAGMLDNDVLAVLMRCENEKTLIDKKLLYKLNNDVHDELTRIENNMYEMAGYEFNLRSSVQVQDLFERMGIDTGYRTETGKMAVGAKVIELLNDDVIEQYPFLLEFVRYKRLEKLRSSYIEVLNRWTDSGFNYVRVPYKTTNVSTGRLASGAGKNTKGSNFFTPSVNIQNIPKQKSCDMYVIDLMDRDIFEEDLTLEIPRIIIMGYQLFPVEFDDKGNEIPWESIKHMYEEEISNPSYKYLGITESGSPNLNIRAMFRANDVNDLESYNEYTITLENGKVLILKEDNLVTLSDGTRKRVRDLVEGDDVVGV